MRQPVDAQSEIERKRIRPAKNGGARRANREAKAAQAAETVANRKTKEAKRTGPWPGPKGSGWPTLATRPIWGGPASDWEQHNLKRFAQRLRRYERADDGVDRRHFEGFFSGNDATNRIF
ncbi:MAG: hypothetical protein Ct9H300mP1_22940 [Planctomycetaceae bacterium]|nr:MAG: hypothetical protein Ct9H300mP1_22940 [Planctomycetaceae bacterium]